MSAQEVPSLPKESGEVIQRLIQRKFEADNLNTSFPNPLLREDVLALLDRYCTVVYYPLEDENNGFHIKIPDASGEERHFVYINTAQTIEKQAFTAAHELGHIWKVNQHVAEQCGLSLDEELGEQIINRFAAELLIPEGWFRDNGYTQFQTPTRKKSINGLAGLLNRAEMQGDVSQDKIDHLRALFDLRPPVTDEQIDELLN